MTWNVHHGYSLPRDKVKHSVNPEKECKCTFCDEEQPQTSFPS